MTMAGLEVRVKSLEETQRSLRELPGRVSALEQRFDGIESQIVQLRAEMRSGFSAIHEALAETNRHMRVLHEEVLSRMKAIENG
jgi:hypothetical protein